MIQFATDIDNCITDTIGTLIKEARRVHKIAFDKNDISTYAVWDWTKLTYTQCHNFFTDVSFVNKHKSFPWSQLVLQRLVSNLYRIHYVTSRPPTVRIETHNWLQKNKFPYMDNVYFTEQKREYAERNNISYFVEDRHKTAVELADVCKAVFLIDQPWNRRPVPGNVVRVNNWIQIMAWFQPHDISKSVFYSMPK